MKKVFIKFLPWLLILILLIGIAFPIVGLINDRKTSKGSIQLGYEGASKGATPAGTRFSIHQIKSEEFLSKVLDVLGDKAKPLSTDDLLRCIEVAPREQVFLGGFLFFATQYVVRVNADYVVSRYVSAHEVMDAILTTFNDDFCDKYLKANLSRFDVDWDKMDTMEYVDVIDIMRNKMSMLSNYLVQMNQKGSLSDTWDQSSSFAALSNSVNSFNVALLNDFEVFIKDNGVFRDAGTFQFKERFQALETTNPFDINYSNYQIYKGIVEDYDPTVIAYAFKPFYNLKKGLFMARTDTGIDDFTIKMKNSYNFHSEAGEKLNKLTNNIGLSAGGSFDMNLDSLAHDGVLLTRDMSIADTSSSDLKKANKMYKEIKTQYDGLIEDLNETMEEYNAKKNDDAISCKISDPESLIKRILPDLMVFFFALVIFVVGQIWRKRLNKRGYEI